MVRKKLFGVPMAITNLDEAVEYVQMNKDSLCGRYISFANVHTTVMAHENSAFKIVQKNAALVMPDGKPLSLVLKMRGNSKAERVAGPDFMEALWKRTAKTGEKHYFYGGSEETLKALRYNLKRKYPGMKVVGWESPPFRQLSQQEEEEAVRRINASGADYVWVGLGAPKQENWMYQHKGQISGVMFGVGAGFDFHAGTVKRAPQWIQKLYMEWAFRLFQDPQRLWKRYAVTNVKFIFYVLIATLRQKIVRQRKVR